MLLLAFLRHMMYLAFVLSLTFTCYCAGLVITWKRRHTFKTYRELQYLDGEEREEETFSITEEED